MLTREGAPPHIRLDRAHAVPDRRQTRMSEQRPRPRAFRLDDQGVAYDDAPAAIAPTAIIRSETKPIPVSTRGDPIDEGEREIEAAQRSGMLRRWRLNFSTLLWSGLGGLVSLTFGLWVTSVTEGLFARAQSLGLDRRRLRRRFSHWPDRPRRARTLRAEPAGAHRRTARGAGKGARRGRSRRRAGGRQSAGRALRQAAGDRPRGARSFRTRRAKSSTGATSSTSPSVR